MTDVTVIGGGASGLALAVMLKQQKPYLRVDVLEQLERVGKKLSVTGNGRCNITNLDLNNRYYSNSLPQAMQILNSFSYKQTESFFSNIGVEFLPEGKKVYPRSLQASSVVDALRFSAESMGVNIKIGFRVESLTKDKNAFCINNEFFSKTAVVAAGGLAGGSRLGSNGDGYYLLKKFGHKIFEQKPVIVQIKTQNSVTKRLKGIKANALVTVHCGSALKFSEFGEVLFCDYGLSGPAVMQLSRHCENGGIIELDLFNDYDENKLYNLILKRRSIFQSYELNQFFCGLLQKRLGQAVLFSLDLKLSNNADTLSDNDCKRLAFTLKHFKFQIMGNTGFLNAQATSGGADLTQFGTKTLMSESVPGLFAIGEVLDVDGDCGGFNLQWAWSSAFTASRGIISYLKESKK